MTYDSGFDTLVGTEVLEASGSRVVMRLRIEPRHLQPTNIVHGGVYATLAESAASIGASLNVIERGIGVGAMGVENHTSFLRSAGSGAVITAIATPIHAGHRLQAWGVSIQDAGDRTLAVATVRLHVAAAPAETAP